MSTGQLPRARKRFGQHFLADQSIADRIVALVRPQPGDLVLEIGPGRGVLTQRLAARGGRLVAVEIDRDLVAYLPAPTAGSA
jgi:16S rRNA (adenine1518-N6/adenine1519-N6)-dimethyltransferase